MKIIALEEHLVVPEIVAAWSEVEDRWWEPATRKAAEGEIGRLLLDVGEERIQKMDESGIDVEVLSLTATGTQNLPPAKAVALQGRINDHIAAAVRAHPQRFQGFANLATPAPADAVRELERAVQKLGLHGAMIFGRTREKNLDHPNFWPIYEAAAALKAPLYLHPQTPVMEVREAYYSGLGKEMDFAFASPGIGWHYETGVQLLRLMLAGVFDRFPDLRIIVGHWGEVVLFYLERIDLLKGFAKTKLSPTEYFKRNVWVTPSGIFSQRYLRWNLEVLGVERILFATDYPYAFASGGGARRFLEKADLKPADREKIASGNWDKLCSEIKR